MGTGNVLQCLLLHLGQKLKHKNKKIYHKSIQHLDRSRKCVRLAGHIFVDNRNTNTNSAEDQGTFCSKVWYLLWLKLRFMWIKCWKCCFVIPSPFPLEVKNMLMSCHCRFSNKSASNGWRQVPISKHDN